MKAMKLIKAVVVLAVFLGTYALKDFTQFADNVYAERADRVACQISGTDGDCPSLRGLGRGEGRKVGKVEIIEPSSTPEAKPVGKEEIKIKTEIVGDTATVTCGKDTPDSKIEELAAQLEAMGVVKLIVKREGSKKSSEKNKKKKDEEAYDLSKADEDDYILAKAWDEVLAMLRGNPAFADKFENPEISDSLAERIDERIEGKIEKFVDAYMERFIKRLSNPQMVNLPDLDDEDKHNIYFEWDEQKEFIKDQKEMLTEQYDELADKGDSMTQEEAVRFRRLDLQLYTLKKLQKAFSRAAQEFEHYIQGGQGTFGGDTGFIPDTIITPGMDPFNPFGEYTQKPQNGWGLNIGSTPFGGVTLGVDRMGQNGNWSINGGYEDVPRRYLEMFGPMGAGGFGGGFGGFNPGAGAVSPYANPMDFMGVGGGYPGGYPGF